MQTLTVVNEMLATMGERPLNSLQDPHAFRGAALACLDAARVELLGKGWQFNTDKLKLSPSVVDKNIYLPGDYLSCITKKANLTVRDKRLYNTDGGSYEFLYAECIELIRDIPFEQLGQIPAQGVSTKAVYDFQLKYDGDSTKSRMLSADHERAMMEMNKEETRNRRVNMLDRVIPLQRIRNAARRYHSGYLGDDA